MSNNDTICALATAPGGALGIIRVSGSEALSAVSSLCALCCDDVAANTIHYTHIHDGADIIDEAMISVFRAPHSYTGEDSVEISCHGSRYILNKVLALLIENGCRQANPGEFTQRAFLNGKMDLSQAAMSQLRGGISSELAAMRKKLLKLTSLLELELDFSDHEDLEFADRSELLQLAQQIGAHISQLAESFNTGQALKEGFPVAIIGAPNVGKSTLLNALLNEERAIVSDIQGTTRDTIEDNIQLGGITFRFIDTAGIRHTSDTIEQMGIERSVNAARHARIIIMMSEPGVPYPNIPVSDDQTVIYIENKTEHFQAKHGIGLETLKQQLIAATPQVSDADIIITNARHYEVLCRAEQSLHRVITGLNNGISGDFLSEDLRDVLNILAEITGGQITPQETLNNIFKHFCVGK